MRRCEKNAYLRKIWMIMKLTMVLFFLAITQMMANEAYSQTTKMTMHIKDVTVKEVLNKIEENSEFYFLYNGKLVDVNRRVSLEVNDQQINEILSTLFQETEVCYTVVDKQIVLTDKANQDSFKQLGDQQQQLVTGKITDASTREIMPGVNIKIKDTNIGTIADAEGKYSLSVTDRNAILIFSFIGYVTKEIPIAGRTTVDVALVGEVKALDEVVVVGYGTVKKSDLTGAVSTINEEQLEGRPTARTTELLQGIAPGLQITRQNAGRIRGANSTITIRGITSRSAPGTLVVIDGIAQKDNNSYALDNINPDDIESISILKDAQAAIYGARAAGGVILVTTKKGRTDKPTINFSSTYTIQSPSLLRKSTNILQLVEMMNEGFVNDGQLVNMYSHIQQYIDENNLTMEKIRKNDGQYMVRWPFDNSANIVFGHYDWNEIMYGTAPLKNYNISVSGKTDKLNYYNSIGYVDQKSMLNYGTNENKRLFVRLKNDFNITNYLTIKTNFGFERQKVIEPNAYQSVEQWASVPWPVHMPFTPNGNLYNFGTIPNLIGIAEHSGDLTDLYYRLRSQLGLVLTPFKNFTLTGEFSTNFDILENRWANIGFDMYNENDLFSWNFNNNRNSAGAQMNRSRYTIGNIYANYIYTFLENHRLNFMAGYSHEEEDVSIFSAERQLGLISAELPTFGLGSSDLQFNSESKTDRSLNSFFSRIEYNFMNRYLSELTFRYDGSSKFAEGYKWSPFFGISGAWVISNEKFMKSLTKYIDFFKIRASWGQLGNEASIGLYDYIAQINIGGSYPMGNQLSPVRMQSAVLGPMASQTRSWETIESTNLGFDFSTLKQRLSGSFDVFIKDNASMFYISEFPQVLGVTAPSINGAHVQTKGWEIVLGWKDKIGNLSYFANMNLSDNTSMVIELADSRIPALGLNNFVEGYSIGSYFGYRFDGLIQNETELGAYKSSFTSGIPNNLKLGDARFKDLDGDGRLRPQLYELNPDGQPTPNSGDIEHLGDAGQHYLFGINLGLNWRNFDFSVFFNGVLKWEVRETNTASVGNVIAPLEYMYDQRWTPENKDGPHPRLSQDFGIIIYNYYNFSDAPYMLYDSRYIRLKNLQIGYTIPANVINRINIENLRVYFSGSDIWELHNLPGTQDPEKPFTDRLYNPLPYPRNYSFGISLTF